MYVKAAAACSLVRGAVHTECELASGVLRLELRMKEEAKEEEERMKGCGFHSDS